MSIRKSAAHNLIGLPNPEFDKQLFDAGIWQKGYNCEVSKAIECPCRGGNEMQALPNCTNCGGIGWVFINPTATRALITGVNRDTKYKQWSQELIGNVSITLRDIEQAGFMDRITLNDEQAIFSEVRKIRTVSETIGGQTVTEHFIFLSYEVENIEDIFIYESPILPLIRLNVNQWQINPDNPYSLIFDDTVITESINATVSVRYKHRVQYHILDIPHIVRSSTVTNRFGQIEKVKMPNQYTARLAHNVIRSRFDGTGITNNDYSE